MNRSFLALCLATLSVPALAEPVPPSPAPTAGSLIGPAIYVSDVTRSLAFYVDGLGMKVRLEMGPDARRETILTFGGDPRSTALILLSDRTATSPAPIEHGHGYDRTVLRVASLAAAETRLKAGGFVITPIREVAAGHRMMLATDPDGYKYELVESAGRP